MRVSEAAQILGVDRNADKQAIDKAARQQIRKWHPDRWRNASEEEQKRAAEEYSKVSKAQKTLQHPETADPEVDDVPSHAPQAYGGGYATTTDPYASGGYSANGGRSQVQYEARFDPSQQGAGASSMGSPFDDVYPDASGGNQRAKYNSAKGFEDSFGAVPDSMEQALNMTHNESMERQYKQFADVMKLSMSAMASMMMFLVSFVMLLAVLRIVNVNGLVEAGSLGDGIASILPAVSTVPSMFTFGILTILALVKMVTYDAFIAPLLAGKIDTMTPSIICGIDMFLCGLIGYAVSSAWPVPRLAYGIMMLIGIVFAVVAVLIKLYRESR